MNIRELWDTVVLRDILGYTVPGALTLFALALLGSALGWTTPHEMLKDALDLGLLSEEPWLPWHPLLAIAVLLALSFVVGHLQILVTQFLETRVPEWDHASRAHRFLAEAHEVRNEQQGEKRTMGDQYREAAIDVFCGGKKNEFQERLESPFAPDEWKPEPNPKVRAAYRLWRLCDYYVQNEYPDMHSTYIGRYYVLALLFTNLGTSSIVLGVCSWLRIFKSPPAEVIGILGVPVLSAVFLGVFTARHRWPRCELVRRLFVVLCLVSAPFLGVAAALFPSSWEVYFGEAFLVLVGVVLIHRSGFFRKQFVVRVFPIFYALTQARVQSNEPPAKETARDTVPGGWRTWLSTGIGAAALGYWLRNRTARKSK